MTFAAASRICLRSPWLLDRIFGGTHNVIYRFPKTEPLAALTIDDSPFACSTPAILDVLERVGAKATFFVIGSYVQGNEALLERMVHMGHEIGNHTLSKSLFRLNFSSRQIALFRATDPLRRP